MCDGICEVWCTCFFVMTGIVNQFFDMLNGDTMFGCELFKLLFVGRDEGDNVTGKEFSGSLVSSCSNFLGGFLGFSRLSPTPPYQNLLLRVALSPSNRTQVI